MMPMFSLDITMMNDVGENDALDDDTPFSGSSLKLVFTLCQR